MTLSIPSRLAAACVAGFIAIAPSDAQGQKALPLPNLEQMLGFKPGADRKLPSWRQVYDYYTALDKASPRVQTRLLGKTTLGRPFIATFISDSSTIANL